MAMAHIKRRVFSKQPPPLCESVGESSGDEDEKPAGMMSRCQCGQFVWPCPRQYPPDAAARKAQKWLIPADLSKEEMGTLFKTVGTRLGHGPKFQKIHVFDEPHKRYNRVTGVRERHKHVVFKMVSAFAHVKFQRALQDQGVYGHFSFNFVGYVAYLRYCLKDDSAKKLLADIDQDPWSWPPVTPAALIAFCDQPSPQMDGRNGQASGRGRKRTFMTFSEITDAFVEGAVRTEKDAWTLAKARKIAGDDTLFNTLGNWTVSKLVKKVTQAWACQTLETGTFCTEPDFLLDAFVPLPSVHHGLQGWVDEGGKTRSLILSGPNSLGKTEFACALMHHVASTGAYHFVNKLDRLRDITFCGGEGLVADEMCFWNKDPDDLKGLLNPEKGADVLCRNRDGFLPRGVPRIFSANWSWAYFWPQDAMHGENYGAICRRVLWVYVSSDLRLPASVASAEA